MLKRLYVHNYKCLVNFELRLGETSLLLGTNGSGKTAVLDVVYAVRQLLLGEAKITAPACFPSAALTTWQHDRVQVVEVDAAVDDDNFRYRLEIEHSRFDKRSARIRSESLSAGDTPLFLFEDGNVQLHRDDGSKGPPYTADWNESALARVLPHPSNKRLSSFVSHMRSVVITSICPPLIGAESHHEDSVLDRHASNFVAWYRQALQFNPGAASRHLAALKPILGGFVDLSLQQSGLDARALMFEVRHGSDDGFKYWLRFDQLSDGQKAIVILYALLHFRSAGDSLVLLLDEPENFVALAEIQPWLDELSLLCGDTQSQAVLCSHHPELIDYLGPADGVMLRRVAASATIPVPISECNVGHSLKLSEQVARGWIDES
ncbi:AAA family ATPase [Candidatus Poriferisodalis sp.]|uniref:AAA family ATPase n=1 Tax=Candidatus Poriferisodalis sp. TaxID=3101277 RepID=UPI003C6EF807